MLPGTKPQRYAPMDSLTLVLRTRRLAAASATDDVGGLGGGRYAHVNVALDQGYEVQLAYEATPCRKRRSEAISGALIRVA